MSHLYGLLGESLKHSISPQIHSMIFKELNRTGYYHLFEVKKEELRNAIYGLKSLGAKGVNVTIPYKTPIMEYIDVISSEAKKIGAINTICFKDNKTIGYNTDYHGFGMMLQKYEVDIKNKKAVILGSGGAAKSVLQYLVDNGIKELIIASRNSNGIKDTFNRKEFKLISYNEIQFLKEQDLIINCTPCGMYPNVEVSPIEKSNISKFSTAIDLIYNPEETLFLKYAREAQLRYGNGLYMLVGQAIKAQELWNDIKINDEAVDTIYKQLR